MYSKKIGVMVDSFRTGINEGISKAAALNANGIQIYAVGQEMDPNTLTKPARKELLNYIKSKGLVVSALCGDLGGHGFAKVQDNEWKIEKSKRIIDLAVDLETNVVTTHIGVVPNDPMHDRYKIMQEACEKLGEYAASAGRYFAIETGPEKTEVLKKFLDSLTTRNVGVNFDPANLVMVTGDDPVQGVYNLRNYIVHTHAKDGIMKKKSDPELMYNSFAEGGIEGMVIGDYFVETPLGEGQVDFDKYLKALIDIGYKGFLTIEREVGGNPEKDIAAAIKFLREKILNL